MNIPEKVKEAAELANEKSYEESDAEAIADDVYSMHDEITDIKRDIADLEDEITERKSVETYLVAEVDGLKAAVKKLAEIVEEVDQHRAVDRSFLLDEIVEIRRIK